MEDLLENCARCKKNHKIIIKKFSKYPVYNNKEIWTHYSICPNTKEPILIKM